MRLCLLRRFLLTIGAAALSAAAAAPGPPAATPASAGDPPCRLDLPEVVATIGDVAITSEEILGSLAARMRQLDHQRYELIEKAVEAAVDERLLARAAAARGISSAQLVALEVEARIVPPSDLDVDAYYRAHPDRLGGPPERVAPRIRAYLENLQRLRLRAGLLARLRVEHRARVLLGPFQPPPEVGTATTRADRDERTRSDG